MTGQVAEDIAAQIAGDADEGETRDPARNPPEQIVGRDQRHKKYECQPYAACYAPARRQASTRYFTPYCVPTEQATAATTARQNDDMRRDRWRR